MLPICYISPPIFTNPVHAHLGFLSVNLYRLPQHNSKRYNEEVVIHNPKRITLLSKRKSIIYILYAVGTFHLVALVLSFAIAGSLLTHYGPVVAGTAYFLFMSLSFFLEGSLITSQVEQPRWLTILLSLYAIHFFSFLPFLPGLWHIPFVTPCSSKGEILLAWDLLLSFLPLIFLILGIRSPLKLLDPDIALGPAICIYYFLGFTFFLSLWYYSPFGQLLIRLSSCKSI